jgi:hypothetical protein
MRRMPLGTVTEILESVDLAVAHAYDDLVFLEQPDFLLQFTKSKKKILVHVNEGTEEKCLKTPFTVLQKRAEEYTMKFIKGGYFRMSQTGQEHLHVEFLTIQ